MRVGKWGLVAVLLSLVFAFGCVSGKAVGEGEGGRPESPDELTATPDGTTVTLTWKDNSKREDGFKIYRKLSDEAGFKLIATVAKNVTEYEDTDLTCDLAPTYKVTAYNYVGESGPTEQVSTVTIPCEAPELTARGKGEDIILSWKPSSPVAEGYRIYRRPYEAKDKQDDDDDTDGDYELIAEVEADVVTYTDADLGCNGSFEYTITAFNAAGETEPSAPAQAVTIPCAPTGFEAVGSGTDVNLTWTDESTNEEGFRIYRRYHGFVEFEAVAEVEADATEYTDTLVCDNWLDYKVVAYNSAGESEPTDVDDAKTLVCHTPTLHATGEDEHVNLGWEPTTSPVAEGYRIYRDIATKDPVLIADIDDIAVRSYVDAGPLDCDTDYEYSLVVYNEAGESVPSVDLANIIPCSPSDLVVDATGEDIDLTWTDGSTHEDGYHVYRRITGSGDYALIADLPQNTASYKDTSLGCDADREYLVAAYNDAGESDYAGPASDVTRPCAPDGLAASSIKKYRLTLSWDDNSNYESNFALERKTPNTSSWSQIASPSANSTSYTDAGLSCDTEYQYRVHACNDAGCSEWSNVADAATVQCWTAEIFDVLADIDGVDLELTGDDKPAVAYGDGGSIYYAEKDSSDWILDTVEDGAVYNRPSLELSSGGNPNIAYHYGYSFGGTNYQGIVYAVKDAGSWSKSTAIGSSRTYSFELGTTLDMDIDDLGCAHIIYRYSERVSFPPPVWWYSAGYATNLNSSGTDCQSSFRFANYPFPTFPGDSQTAAYLSLRTYYDSGDIRAWAAGTYHWWPWPGGNVDLLAIDVDPLSLSGNVYTVDGASSNGAIGYFCSLELDAGDDPIIAYHNYGGAELKVARYDGSSWSREVVDSRGDTGADASLALDGDGDEAIVYVRAAGYYYMAAPLLLAVRDDGGDFGVEDFGVSPGWAWTAVSTWPDVEVDSEGYVHIVYYYDVLGGLVYMTNAELED